MAIQQSLTDQMENKRQRLIGEHVGENTDILLVCFGAMHGNEPAGLRAIELVLKMLEIEPIKNKDFRLNGKFLGLIGNLKALELKKRFIDKDLNRMFTDENVEKIMNNNSADLINEQKELYELINYIKEEVALCKPKKLVVLDLHTTSSDGGIFTICRRDDEAIRIAKALHAPVVLGMLDGLRGTTLHYFRKDTMGVETIGLTFESGQHEQQLSVNRAIAGIISVMREIGMINAEDVENYHEEILKEFSENLPSLTLLVDRYDIGENDTFRMRPGYSNFQTVKEGEFLAWNNAGKILAKASGRILMPLYQDQGEDGYFIIKDIGDDYRFSD